MLISTDLAKQEYEKLRKSMLKNDPIHPINPLIHTILTCDRCKSDYVYKIRLAKSIQTLVTCPVCRSVFSIGSVGFAINYLNTYVPDAEILQKYKKYSYEAMLSDCAFELVDFVNAYVKLNEVLENQ